MGPNTSVQAFISKMDAGTVFSIGDITVDTSYDSIKTQISNACLKKIVVRITRGIYYKPKYNKLLSKYVPYNMDDVIQTIARSNGWRIVPSGNACMNLVGLTTQVPSKYIYLSDGPNKKYDIDGKIVEFKHRAPKNLPKSLSSAILVQAIKGKKIDNIDHDSMTSISKYIRDNDIDVNDLNNVSLWVKKIIKEAYRGSFLH